MDDRQWIYGQALGTTTGVTLTPVRIEWWESGGSFGGGWSEQSFADFIVRGPPVEDVPADVVTALAEAVRELLAPDRFRSGRPEP